MGGNIPLHFIQLRIQWLIKEFLSQNTQSGFMFELEGWMESTCCVVLIKVTKRHSEKKLHESTFNLTHKEDVLLLEKHLQNLGNTFFIDNTSPTIDN